MTYSVIQVGMYSVPEAITLRETEDEAVELAQKIADENKYNGFMLTGSGSTVVFGAFDLNEMEYGVYVVKVT